MELKQYSDEHKELVYGKLLALAAAGPRLHELPPSNVASTRPSLRAYPGRATITVDENIEKTVDEAIELLAEYCGSRRDNAVYQRNSSLVRIIEKPPKAKYIERDGAAARIAEIEEVALAERLSSAAMWVKEGSDSAIERPPPYIVQTIMLRKRWPGIPVVTAVAESPVLRADGEVVCGDGYDETTGLYFDCRESFPDVPREPTRRDVKRSIESLRDVVADFPFAKQEGNLGVALWLAAVMTPFTRYAFDGCAPLFLFDANSPGTGKGLLADVTAWIALGREFPKKGNPENDAEFRKYITSIAIAGESAVLIDNVTGSFGCASFAAALTGTTWTDRILQTNKTTGSLPLYTTWYATGNNAVLVQDLSRRTLPIRLKSPVEKPEERTGFRHPDLLRFVRHNRAKLATDVLTILRGYCAAGRPDQRLPAWGSFTRWSDLVRNTIVWTGIFEDPGKVRIQGEDEISINREADELRQLMAAWQDVCPLGNDDGMTVPAALELLRLRGSWRKEDLYDPYSTIREVFANMFGHSHEKPANPKAIGYKLRKYRERVCDGMMFLGRKINTGTAWRLVEVAPDGDDQSRHNDRHPYRHQHRHPHKASGGNDLGNQGDDGDDALEPKVNFNCNENDMHILPAGNDALESSPSSHRHPVDCLNGRHLPVERDCTDNPAYTRVECGRCGETLVTDRKKEKNAGK